MIRYIFLCSNWRNINDHKTIGSNKVESVIHLNVNTFDIKAVTRSRIPQHIRI